MACSQKVNCSPQTNTATVGGSHAVRRVSKGVCPCSRTRWASVWSCGNKVTARASHAMLSAAQAAANRFNAGGIHDAGSQRNGKVTR